MITRTFSTPAGIKIVREESSADYGQALDSIVDAIDRRRGLVFSSTYEFPGRYTKWSIGFRDPPLVLESRARDFSIQALNDRGCLLLPPIAKALEQPALIKDLNVASRRIDGRIHAFPHTSSEELRSRQPSMFSVLRTLIKTFSCEDRHLGFYGAFGYDLVFQFDAIRQTLDRQDDQRDLVLYFPDDILLVNPAERQAINYRYEFETEDGSTEGMDRTTAEQPYTPECRALPIQVQDHIPGEYAASVETARAAFRRGDLFEVVLSQVFAEPWKGLPSTAFKELQRANPAPYGALINLGEGEFLVAASPEMFVRVAERRIETCPISGTISRGEDAVEDAERIRTLLNSTKDEAELTMCTDVDRNDKYRVCESTSVKVIGRRQIEVYSRLIHTVDHVEGVLRPEFDALDGFLSHTWAVTVTGAPKRWAIQFIEDHEKTQRRWYGGAIGRVSVDGSLDTGLTLRTIRMRNGVGEVRAGATLLFDSDPVAEDTECLLKASALVAALRERQAARPATPAAAGSVQGGLRVLLVDHEDSFVHTLGGYFRQLGANVVTLRANLARARLASGELPDLLVLSPGPGKPTDFDISATLKLAMSTHTPVFGVCLGLQGIVEHFGGSLGVLDKPAHGTRSSVHILGGQLLAGLPTPISVGRYHSLYANLASLPKELRVTAKTDDGIVMAIEHASMPIAAVQFHPESILTSSSVAGIPIIENVLRWLGARRNDRSEPLVMNPPAELHKQRFVG
jgi:anthranilate synthase